MPPGLLIARSRSARRLALLGGFALLGGSALILGAALAVVGLVAGGLSVGTFAGEETEANLEATSDASSPFDDASPSEPKSRSTPRLTTGRVRELMRKWAAADDAARGVLEKVLRDAGVERGTLKQLDALDADDPRERVRQARRLASRDDRESADLLYLLSFDESPDVRVAAIEAVRGRQPDACWRERVAELERTDPSERVRGYAALIRTDWGLPSDNSPADVAGRRAARRPDARTHDPRLGDADVDLDASNRPRGVTSSRPHVASNDAAHVAGNDAPRASNPFEQFDDEPRESTRREMTLPPRDDSSTLPGAAARGGRFVPSLLTPVAPFWGPSATPPSAPPSSVSHSTTPPTGSVSGHERRPVSIAAPDPAPPSVVREMLRVESFADSFDDSPNGSPFPKPVPRRGLSQRGLSQSGFPQSGRSRTPGRNEVDQDSSLAPILQMSATNDGGDSVLGDGDDENAAGVVSLEGGLSRVLGLPATNGSSASADGDGLPGFLDRPLMPEFPEEEAPAVVPADMLFTTTIEPPLGFSGPSSIEPSERQTSGHFVPLQDRWRAPFPAWDRYGKGHPALDDYPYVEGHWWDPYNQNVLKGDYPIYGQHTFLNVTLSEVMLGEFRKLPTATTPFESTARPFQEPFFGRPNQFFFTNFLTAKFEVFHGNAGFKPADWRVRVTPVFNMNYLHTQELAVVNPDVRKGRKRSRDDFALQEWFIERKLADLSPDYDFVSLRVGSQPFVSDFRGFIFADTNRAARLFGTLFANRDQFNLIAFDQQEKDTNSGLNTHGDRHQQVFIANYYRQDFLFPGYTQQASVHYNHDQPSFKFDQNDFLVRPDPAGVAQPHEVNALYLGMAGDGHFGRYNISHAFYWAMGQDSLNPIAGREQDIDAKMAAVELSYDRDWVRFRTSYFYASGDDDVFDKYARGFDTIFDNANFAGGQFSFWQRQNIPLFGVNLVNRGSLVPDLRASKIQGQSNFVNPGLQLLNFGMDFDVTPKVKAITNVSHLWFDSTTILEQFTFQDKIRSEIGLDLSLGVEYRPLLNDNVVLTGGVSSLVPGRGFDDLYGISDPLRPFVNDKISAPTLYAAFLEMALVY